MSQPSALRYLSRRERGEVAPIVAPEGVPLRFVVAAAGDRIGAFVVDLLLQAAVLAAVIVPLAIVEGTAGIFGSSGWLSALAILVFFLLQNFWFVWFEARGQGSTPGKRRLGIRVISSSGGPLTIEAVLARNLTRNVEIWIPLVVVIDARALLPGAPGWIALLAWAWVLLLAATPLFNRHRLRLGDMVAGTRVVLAARAVLLDDAVLEGPPSARAAAPQAPATTATTARAAVTPAAARRMPFTAEQLGIYGIYELQVLEDLLREHRPSARHGVTRRAVAERIARKIGHRPLPAPQETDRFLRDFYAALRAHLEQRMLLGRRKQDKHDREG